MRFFKYRPLAVWCYLFAALSLVLFFCPPFVKLAVAALGATVLLLAIWKFRSYARVLHIGVGISLLLVGLISFVFFDCVRFPNMERLDNQTVTVTGSVRDVRPTDGHSDSCIVAVDTIDGENFDGKISFWWTQNELSVGDEISLTATLAQSIPDEGGFLRYYSFSQDILFTAEVSRLNITDTPYSFWRFFADLRNQTADVFRRTVGGDAGELVSGLLIGVRSGISDSIERDFRRCGVTHILSVSGMHLSILFGMLVLTFGRFLRTEVRYPIIVIFTTFFVCLVGFQGAVLRSAVMAIYMLTADLLYEENDSITGLGLAAALILFFSPASVLDIGFLLSTLATFGIVSVSVPLMEKFHTYLKKHVAYRPRKYILALVGSIVVTFSATFFTLPLSALCFDSFALLTPIANLILVPLSSLVFWLAVPVLICGVFFPQITLFATLTRWLADFFLSAAAWCSRLEGITACYTTPALTLLIFAVCGAVLLLLLSTKKMRTVYLSFVLAFAVLIGAVTVVRIDLQNELRISFYASKDGDLLLAAHGNTAVLIVSGTPAYETLELGVAHLRNLVYIDELSAVVLLEPSRRAIYETADFAERFLIRQIVLYQPTLSLLSLAKRQFSRTGATPVGMIEDQAFVCDTLQIFASADEAAVTKDGRGVYYSNRESNVPSAFYYRHMDSLCMVLCGAASVVCGSTYSLPTAALPTSLSSPREKDVLLSATTPFLIRLDDRKMVFDF